MNVLFGVFVTKEFGTCFLNGTQSNIVYIYCFQHISHMFICLVDIYRYVQENTCQFIATSKPSYIRAIKHFAEYNMYSIKNTMAIVCTALLFVSSSSALSYKKFNADASIESIIQDTCVKKETILQYCFDRVDDRMLTLLGSVGIMLRTELNTTKIDILNTRVIEQVREFTNDVWIIIRQAEKALDIMFQNSERRIEIKLGFESPALHVVEDVFRELKTIIWSFLDASARMLYDTNEFVQQIADGLAYDTFDALQQSGRAGVETFLTNRRNAALQFSYETRDQILEIGESDNSRINELSMVLRNAVRQS